ncbi:MAG: ABC transporter substrate-binding protein [Casimicrobiaceae bacterium]
MNTMVRNVASAMACVVALATCAAAPAIAADVPVRTLRVGIPRVPETFDPARASDMLTWYLIAGTYDTLYVLDPVARPAAIVPTAAAALPEASADYRTFTIRVRPGIFFTPHPSFGGRPRELTAADFAYAFKRVIDPKVRSPALYLVEGKIEGLDALAQRAKDAGIGIDYDAPVPGLVVVDRQTLRIRLNAPDPIFPFLLTAAPFAGVAREVIAKEGEGYGQNPVGTGAFLVAHFVPGRRLVFAHNPDYRAMYWENLLTPASLASTAVHPMRGKRLPAADRIEFSSTPEESAELLALRRRELDLIYATAPELLADHGKLKSELAREGLRLVRDPAPVTFLTIFSMRDRVIGGDARDKVALRRALLMAFDDAEWTGVFDAGFSTTRHQVVPPGIEGNIPGYRNPNGFDPATANAILDRTGYRRGPDGYRRNPEGSALTVSWLIGTSSGARQEAEFTKRMLDRIGIRVAFVTAPGAERQKLQVTCHYGVSVMDWALDVPDGTNVMSAFWSKAIGSVNLSCFADMEFDAAYEKALVTPPGPARTELFRTMQTRLDTMAATRPRPSRENLLLKRGGVLGPFATINDWLQVVTLGFETRAESKR